MRTFESEIEYLVFLRDEVIPYSRTQKYHSPGNKWREELRIKKFSKLRKDIIYWRTGLGWQLRKIAEEKVREKLTEYDNLEPKVGLIKIKDMELYKLVCPSCFQKIGELMTPSEVEAIADQKIFCTHCGDENVFVTS